MLSALALLVVGAAILYAGAETAVRGAAGLARAFGVRSFVIGALLFGVDLEGLGAAVVGAARGETALAAGEIFGTILFLFSAAFGAALLLAPGPVPSPQPAMVVAPALHLVAGAVAISDRYVHRVEGALLVVMYVAYIGLLLRMGRMPASVGDEIERDAGGATRSRAAQTLVTVAGLALLAVGAAVLVDGGTRFAAAAELAPGFVGAAVLGVLVSLDEVLLEVIPVRRGDPELATGNLFGTLAAFSAGVLGIAALVRPLDVDSGAATAQLGVAVLYAVVATTFLVRRRAGRVLGASVVACYVAWLLLAARI